MTIRFALTACFLFGLARPALDTAAATEPRASVVSFHGYDDCIELANAATRVVLCPAAGGRVLVYAYEGRNVLYLNPAEAGWTLERGGPGGGMSAGRFDIGPEKVQARRDLLWRGRWNGEPLPPNRARLTSQVDPVSGFQLVREFTLDRRSTRLDCRQTIINRTEQARQACHWSRTFALGGGVCVVPLTPLGRFPAGYVMYDDPSSIDYQPRNETVRQIDDMLVIDGPTANPKLGFDSHAGWIAYLTPIDLLFVKRFPTFPDRAYSEVAGLTLSVWYPDRPMCELEPIGPREVLAPGEQASFTEQWSLAPYPFPREGRFEAVDEVASIVERLP